MHRETQESHEKPKGAPRTFGQEASKGWWRVLYGAGCGKLNLIGVAWEWLVLIGAGWAWPGLTGIGTCRLGLIGTDIGAGWG